MEGSKHRKQKILLFFIAFFVFSALSGQILKRKVTIAFEDEPLVNVLRTLEHDYNIHFSYDSDFIIKDKTVTLSYQNVTINYLLNALFKGTNVGYMEIQSHIVLFKTESNAEVTKPKSTSTKENSPPMTRVVRYVYDTIRKVVVDTVVTYRIDTLLVQDTIIYKDTLRISIYDKGLYSKFSIGILYSQPIGFKRNYFEGSDSLFLESEKNINTYSDYAVSVHGSYNTKTLSFSLGAGYYSFSDQVNFHKDGNYLLYEKTDYWSTDTIYLRMNVVDIEKTYTYDSIPYGTNEAIRVSRTVVVPDTSYTQVRTSILKDSTYEVTDTLAKEINVNKKRNISYAYLPLKIGLRKELSSKFILDVSQGLNGYMIIYANDKTDVVYDEFIWNKFYFTSETSLSITYKIEKRIGVTLGGQFRTDISSRYKSNVGMSRKVTQTAFLGGLTIFL